MRILGLDPGLATVGFAVVDSDKGRLRYVSCGTINTPAHTSLSERLNLIYTDLEELFTAFAPDVVSIEELFFGNNITTGIAVAHARGVMLLAAVRRGLPVYEYTPMQVKQSVVGYGLAEKRQVIDMTRRLLRLSAPPKPDDAADAVALAICHARSVTSLLAEKGGAACSTI